MARSASAVAERAKYIKTDYICTSKESKRPAPDTLDETLPYRQIWRNHILGASMVLGLSEKPDDKLTEFTSLTVYPEDNGHFSEVWNEYESKLTPDGLNTFKHITYEELFPLMQEFLSKTGIPHLNEWIDYLNRRYIIK